MYCKFMAKAVSDIYLGKRKESELIAHYTRITPHYMTATKAFHLLGEISSEEPGLCRVYAEDDDNFYGVYVTGFGFFDVRFPKSTTKTLTEKEKGEVNDEVIAINDIPSLIIKVS